MTEKGSPGQEPNKTEVAERQPPATEVGRHVILECWDCNEQIHSREAVESALREAVRRSKVTLLKLYVHEFAPQGISAVALIAESHIFIHTWPEHSYIAFDAFTCGDSAMPEEAVKVIKAVFEPKRVKSLEFVRGRWF